MMTARHMARHAANKSKFCSERFKQRGLRFLFSALKVRKHLHAQNLFALFFVASTLVRHALSKHLFLTCRLSVRVIILPGGGGSESSHNSSRENVWVHRRHANKVQEKFVWDVETGREVGDVWLVKRSVGKSCCKTSTSVIFLPA